MADGVVVAYAHPGTVTGAFHDSLLSLMERDNGRIGTSLLAGRISAESGPLIATTRNLMVRRFLSGLGEWLWMLDADMEFGPDTLDRLMDCADADERPIMGGLTFGGRHGRPFVCMYRFVEDGPAPIERVLDFPRDQVVKVAATGCACLLIHRSVLETMAKVIPEPRPWFADSTYKGIEYGEDVTFCLRAAQLDIPVHVHTGVSIGHVKTRVIGLDDFDFPTIPTKSKD